MPYCIDQWKRWSKKRKAYGKVLRLVNIYCASGPGADVARAFMKWRRKVRLMMARLNGMTQE